MNKAPNAETLLSRSQQADTETSLSMPMPQRGRANITTSDTRDIIGFAPQVLERTWRDGYRYAKAVVTLGDFFQSGEAQLDMFSQQVPSANADMQMSAVI